MPGPAGEITIYLSVLYSIIKEFSVLEVDKRGTLLGTLGHGFRQETKCYPFAGIWGT
jgi:hypothetical protein